MVHETEAWQTIATERRALADLLEGLTPEQWGTTTSLCDAWTVKGVAIHLMVGPTGSLRSFLSAMVAARGRFERANVVLVQRKMAMPVEAVVADLRDRATSRFAPPTMDVHAPLTDLLVHRLDICVPLGIKHERSLDPWAEALDFLLSPRARRGFLPQAPPELTYAATDLAWTGGSGPRVEGPVEAIALAILGRSPRLDELAGPGAEVLREWAR